MVQGDNDSNFFVHGAGICESSTVGDGTRIWAFAHILSGAKIGRNCNICDHVFVENDVVLGNDVTVKSGVQLWDGIRISDRVFIGPNATFTNDRFPRSGHHLDHYPETTVEEGASIGANATILPGVRIGRKAMVGAGTVVVADVPANAIVVGNPAIIVGYQDTSPNITPENDTAVPLDKDIRHSITLGVGSCKLFRMPSFVDMRGSLVPIEFKNDLPFVPVRSFLVHRVPSNQVRGEHAHKDCHQFLLALKGKLAIVLDDGVSRREVELTDATQGLYISPMVWAIQYKFDPETVLLVLASDTYDAADYIRDYDTFRRAVGADDVN